MPSLTCTCRPKWEPANMNEIAHQAEADFRNGVREDFLAYWHMTDGLLEHVTRVSQTLGPLSPSTVAQTTRIYGVDRCPSELQES